MSDTLTEVSTPASRIVNPNPGHCRVCGISVAHPRQYCDEHRPPKAPKSQAKRAKGQRTTPSQAQGKTGAELLKDSLRDISETKQPKKPTVEATTKVIGKVVYYIFLALVMSVVGSDATLTEQEQEQVSGELALSSEDAEAIARPVARFLTPTSFWQKSGPQIIANSDIVDAIVAAYNATSGLMRYQRERKRREAYIASLQPGNPQTNGHAVIQQAPRPQPSDPDQSPVPASQAAAMTIPPSADVLSAEAIAAIRRQHGQPEAG